MIKWIITLLSFSMLAILAFFAIKNPTVISGTYVAKNENQAFLIQIIQNDNKQLTGFYQEADLEPDGQLKQLTLNLSGYRDGKILTLTLEPNNLYKLFMQPLVLSGSFSGNHIIVDGQSSDFKLNLILEKSDAKKYQEIVSYFEKKSLHIKETNEIEKNITDFSLKINSDINKYQKVNSSLPLRIQQLSTAIYEIQGRTKKMQAALLQEEAIGGSQSVNGMNIVLRIENAYNQENSFIDAEKNHLENVQRIGSPALLKEMKSDSIYCKNIMGMTIYQNNNDLKNNCYSLDGFIPDFESKIKYLMTAYQKLFSIWDNESAIQRNIIAQANKP